MSIIYDALKKVQATGGGSPDKKENSSAKKRPKGLYLVCGLVICAAIFAGNVLFKAVDKYFYLKVSEAGKTDKKTAVVAVPPVHAVPATTPAPAVVEKSPSGVNAAPAQSDGPGSLILNGVYFSDNDGYALINNQIYREGETSGGVTIKRIEEDCVEVEYEGKLLKLYTR